MLIVFLSHFSLQICNALDNVPSRVYVDKRCVELGRPFIDCGTLGVTCSVLPVIPYLTNNYVAPSDSGNDSIRLFCFLLSFFFFF
jgi:ubiquitin-activating enzyme E1